jgi:tRNA1Val (adenine37-N6)-methyltransferase
MTGKYAKLFGDLFEFKEFTMRQGHSGQRINTDSCVFADVVEAENPRTALDIGTGTGVIALMMAAKFPEAHITAVEINDEYAAIARMNFAASPWASRLSLETLPVQDFARDATVKFDLVVCNPPFFSDSTKSRHPDRAMARHDDALPPAELAKCVACLIAPYGVAWILCAAGDEAKWVDAMHTFAKGMRLASRVEMADCPEAKPHAVALCFQGVGAEKAVAAVTSRRIDYRQARGGEKSAWMQGHRARWFFKLPPPVGG